jgi:hypothetical protein
MQKKLDGIAGGQKDVNFKCLISIVTGEKSF